ncbi:EcoKI restriction-modification system protein HsdS [compost metagenome]
MSVDKLRETHHINRVAPSDLGLLMSAQSYRPEITQAIRKIKSFPWAPLQSLVKNVISPGPHPVYGGTYPCLKTKNVNELLADLESADFANVKGIGNLEKVQVERGDLLINLTGAGSIGRVSIYYGNDLPITNQHIARMGIKDAYDEGYVAAFLRSWWGERALEQGVAGSTGQINMVNDHVRSIPVIIFNAAVQKYIGDKVRQAELLRTWAKALEERFDLSLKKLSPEAFENRGTGKKYSRASVADISYTLNPGAFDEERLRVQHYLLGLGGKRFSKLADISGATTSSYKPDSTYIGLDAISSNTCKLTPSTVEKAEISGTCRLLNEGPVIAKLRPYLNKVSYISQRFTGAVGSTELLCITPRSNYSGWYLYGVLKSELTLKQLRPLATGATHPRIDQYDVYDLVVPVLDDQEALGQLLKMAQTAYFLASELTVTAKLLVEDLIEGQITEAQLIAAEQALQAGNDTLDRKILSRLKTDGIDGEGAALFSDLDELYRLLALAEV